MVAKSQYKLFIVLGNQVSKNNQIGNSQI